MDKIHILKPTQSLLFFFLPLGWYFGTASVLPQLLFPVSCLSDLLSTVLLGAHSAFAACPSFSLHRALHVCPLRSSCWASLMQNVSSVTVYLKWEQALVSAASPGGPSWTKSDSDASFWGQSLNPWKNHYNPAHVWTLRPPLLHYLPFEMERGKNS